MGVVQFSIGLLSNIPCPHIFGRIIDATCIVWNKVCGVNSYCSFYNSTTFRRLFFGKLLPLFCTADSHSIISTYPGVSCFIMLLAFVMDLVVFFKSHRIDIDPEGNDGDPETNKEHPEQGEQDLLKLRKLSHDIDEEQHTKIGM